MYISPNMVLNAQVRRGEPQAKVAKGKFYNAFRRRRRWAMLAEADEPAQLEFNLNQAR